MRSVIAVALLGVLVRTSAAGEARGSGETLVGWSEDGQRYAITGFTTKGDSGPEFFIEVRDGTRSVARWKEGDKEVEGMIRPDRLDVASWTPIKKFALKKVAAAARKKFAAELVAVSTTKVTDRYHCGEGGWSLMRKGDRRTLHEVKVGSGHCVSVIAGYLDRRGTRVLVKLREAWRLPGKPAEKVTEENETFVLVELPAS
jgi:hypothetical protein